MADHAPIPEDRPLTPQEQSLVRWLLEHGHPDAASYLPQLDQARVVSRCPCGCASIDFSIGGAVPPLGTGMRVLSDYVWQADDGTQCGVFVYSCGGLLAGLEVWSADGMEAVSALPAIERLRPMAVAQCAERGAADVTMNVMACRRDDGTVEHLGDSRGAQRGRSSCDGEGQ